MPDRVFGFMHGRKGKHALCLALCSNMAALLSCNLKANSDADDKVSYGQRKYIVGGQEVDASDPVAATTVVLLNSQGKMRCSGTLIAPRLVLSAAHCFVDPGLENSNLLVGFGIDTTQLVRRSVKSFVAHPEYDPDRPLGDTAPLYDVALMELSEDAPTSSIAAKVPDPSFVLSSGTPLLMAGFGLSYTDGTGGNRTGGGAGTLRKVTLPLNQILLASKQIKVTSNAEKAVCSGDSGGPAFVSSQSDGLVVSGVTSWGYSRCENGLSVFSDVRQYSDWIVANSQGHLSSDQLLKGDGQPPPSDDTSHPPAPAPYTAIVDSAYALLADIRQGRVSQAFGEVKDRNSGKYTRSFLFLFRNTEPKHYCVHLRGDGSTFDGTWGSKRGSYMIFDKLRISELANFDSFGCSWQSARTGWYWYLE